jgi:hypothetical protein
MAVGEVNTAPPPAYPFPGPILDISDPDQSAERQLLAELQRDAHRAKSYLKQRAGLE